MLHCIVDFVVVVVDAVGVVVCPSALCGGERGDELIICDAAADVIEEKEENDIDGFDERLGEGEEEEEEEEKEGPESTSRETREWIEMEDDPEGG